MLSSEVELHILRRKKICKIFIFGALHPVVRALSRLSEEPSFATTVQVFVSHTFLTATCFDRHLGQQNNCVSALCDDNIFLYTLLIF
jgi:hypothetical protein